MPRSTDTRERMIRTAAQLFRRQGYCATGWRQVVAESATPWGSLAHHFPDGKEQLLVEAVIRSGATYAQLLRALLADRHPADAVDVWTEHAARELAASGWSDGCPVATVTLERAHASQPVARACADALGSWQLAIRDALVARGLADPESDALATVVLAGIEGALVLARAERDPRPLHVVGRELAALLRSRVPA